MDPTLLRAACLTAIEPVPTLLMAVATVGWLRGNARPLGPSDRLELLAACALLNGVALTYWFAARGDARALLDWSLHGLAAGLTCLLLGRSRPTTQRSVLATLGPSLACLGVALLSAGLGR